MAASQQFLLIDNSSLANFKNWAQAISSFFTAAGWTQTADTGQVNWSTIVSVPAAGTFVYEMWQPADALQTGATAYFVKMQYGTSANSPAGPRITVQIGTGTNGSGTLTGITSSSTNEITNNSITGQGSVPYECDFSGDTGRIAMCFWRTFGTSQSPYFFAIERTLDVTGAGQADGVTLFCRNNSGGALPGQQTLVFGKGMSLAYGREFVSVATQTTDNVFNGIAVSPVFPDYGKLGNPHTVVCFAPASNITFGAQFQTTMYSGTKTFLCIGSMDLTVPSGSIVTLCMRFD